MAVLIEAISVIIKAKDLLAKYKGTWEEFKETIPNQTLCADGEIVRVGFMTPEDVKDYVTSLEKIGLIYIRDNMPADLIIVDQQRGPTISCPWIEYGKIRLTNESQKLIAACRLAGSKSKQLVLPNNWSYENSLSSKYTFISSEDVNGRMVQFDNLNGLKTYFDLKTGQDMFLGGMYKNNN